MFLIKCNKIGTFYEFDMLLSMFIFVIGFLTTSPFTLIVIFLSTSNILRASSNFFTGKLLPITPLLIF